MCWRQVSKLQKTACLVIFYFAIYLIVSYITAPAATVSFVSDDFRVGDKYVFMYLITSEPATFSDTDGANVFDAARCGSCFITNNRGFLPPTEYDAVLRHGGPQPANDSENTYLIETSGTCLRRKLRRCPHEPRITRARSDKVYTLCSLCRELFEKRNPET